ncbi:hypothetical protein J6590_083742 [Homalodisca vitripennis]|nr:hypothetical protein J6590_083742 [Homalodisca vitripennis]
MVGTAGTPPSATPPRSPRISHSFRQAISSPLRQSMTSPSAVRQHLNTERRYPVRDRRPVSKLNDFVCINIQMDKQAERFSTSSIAKISLILSRK